MLGDLKAFKPLSLHVSRGIPRAAAAARHRAAWPREAPRLCSHFSCRTKMPNYMDVLQRSLPDGVEVMASTDRNSNSWGFFSVIDVSLYSV